MAAAVATAPGVAAGAPPVEIRGLAKRFRNGVLAVDGLDLTVGPGEVYGLLGLNGAGKTTTLRLLIGLARPTSGTISIFGERVRPGAPVLSRVGSLVDTPGFAPHLSGRANLAQHWEAGGGDPSSGAVEEALALAALGADAERPVKQYSFGMRQRLGLARALMGRPELVVLDEPTTGMDPQQVRQVRSLVRELAAGGTTMLISSHLLTEVEQVCSHAAVIDHGRIVATGTVDDLTGASSSLYVEVDDLQAALSVLRDMPGVAAARLDGAGILVELAGAERKQVAAALVRSGIGLETVMARHRLEDAFLGLLADTQPTRPGQ